MAELPPRSDDPIFRKLSKEGIDDQALRREDDRFEELVAMFSDLIRFDVEQESSQAPADEVSRELVIAASAFLRAPPALSSSPNEVAQASEQVRREIAEEILKDVGKPDAEELEANVRDLSQGLLSNWLALLQKANRLREGSSRRLQLSADALPVNGFARSLLFQGLEFHSLTNDILETRFRTFLEKLREPSFLGLGVKVVNSLLGRRGFQAIELAPDLALVAGNLDTWYLTSSNEEASHLIEQLRAEQPGTAVPLQDFNADWALSAVEACSVTTDKPSWQRALVLEVIDQVASDVARGLDKHLASDLYKDVAFDEKELVLPLGKDVVFGLGKAGTLDVVPIQALSDEVVAITIGSFDPSRKGTSLSSATACSLVHSGVSRIHDILDAMPQYAQAPKLEACQVIFGTAYAAVVKAAAIKAGVKILPARAQVTSPETAVVADVARQMAEVMLRTPEAQTSIAALAHFDLTAYS